MLQNEIVFLADLTLQEYKKDDGVALVSTGWIHDFYSGKIRKNIGTLELLMKHFDKLLSLKWV